MYFYIYNGEVYWGRHQNLRTRRNVFDTIFRYKPVLMERWYISGPWTFRVTFNNKVFRHWLIQVSYCGKPEYSFPLCEHTMVHVWKDYTVYIINKSSITTIETENAFKNRLREYRGKYFLPFSKHVKCV